MLLAFLIISFTIGITSAFFAWKYSREYFSDGGMESDGVTYSTVIFTVTLWTISIFAFVAYMLGIAKLTGIF
jgi:hypothetical protein